MQKSQIRQFILTVILGPFGLFYTNAIAALAITLATLSSIYFSPEHILYILPASAIASMLVGASLVGYHNRQIVRNFELSTYIGSVSCKATGEKSVDRNYQNALRRVRRGRFRLKIEIFILASLCMAFSVMLVTPYIQNFIPLSNLTKNELRIVQDVPTIDARNSYSSQPVSLTTRKPIWKHHQDDKSLHITLAASQYENSSDGMYLPKINLNCEANNYTVSFIIEEILGTEMTTLLVSPDNHPPTPQNWKLSQNYRTAIAPSATSVMESLRSARSIALSYNPFGSETKKIATFDLTGSTKVINEFQNQCDQLHSV